MHIVKPAKYGKYGFAHSKFSSYLRAWYKKAVQIFKEKIKSFGKIKLDREITAIENQKVNDIKNFKVKESGRLRINKQVNKIRGYYKNGAAWCESYDIKRIKS